MPRTLARLAIVLSILAAASLSTRAQELQTKESQAQELKARQITWVYDISTIQMPVEIVSIKLNGKDIVPGEKIQGDENWLKGISFTLKNISDQPISYVNVSFKFPLPNGFVSVGVLNYGLNTSHGEIRRGPLPAPIQPGQTQELVLTKDRWTSFLHVLAQANAPRDFETAPFYVERVCFEGQPDVIWQAGWLRRRHAVEPGRFDTMQKYFLPVKDK
jgi:hypothetical protein